MAIATPVGIGAVGIVRLSGPEAKAIATSLFKRPLLPRTAAVGRLKEQDGTVLDQAIALYFPAPHSYTGEEVVEFHCHGAPYLLNRVVEACLKAGARLADAGEFTRRAFLNGKLDLTRAEAVGDLLGAMTQGSHRQAIIHLEGRLATRIRQQRDKLLGAVAEIEAAVDFPDDVPEPAFDELLRVVETVRGELQHLLATADEGRIWREGLQVVLVGRPNVGKSSLLNALVGHERAIVTSVPGTTRDTLEEWLSLEGIPVRLVDTAGLRESDDLVEQMGIARARRALEAADVVLWLVEANGRGLDDEPPGEAHKRLLVANKADLGGDVPGAIQVSAKTGEGLDQLKLALLSRVTGAVPEPDRVTINGRQRQVLLRASAALDRWRQAEGLPIDVWTVDLKDAIAHLGEVTGEAVHEQVVGEIFSRFCIGK